MPSSLLTLHDACAAIDARVQVLGVEQVLVASALGRVAADPVVAVEQVPGFDNSAMDGYAVRSSDTTGAPVTLPVSGEARAGRPSAQALRAGGAMRISTGAVLPAGADAVVRSELAESSGDALIGLRAAVPAGSDVRRAGEEIAEGGVLVGAGTEIGPIEIGALAAAGVEALACRRRPRVAIVVTGDELTGAGKPLAPGGVRDSNRSMLQALVEARGAQVVSSQAAPDQARAVTAAIVTALERADLILTCGGISVGPHDHVRSALASAGVELVFAGVALAPGRPAAFGLDQDGRPVLGLPGNPLSALVAFRLLAEPALHRLTGGSSAARKVTAAAVLPLARRPGRTRAIPCRIGGEGATPVAVAGHGPTAALGADGLALVAPGEGFVARGAPVEVALF
ncbi:MAG: molybdopterin molybdotransferase MoeA [Solirubrobacterales bacterium]|nr:molybdopterin molybdotransferase MoeA [Solirubrobacterales bacterium]